LLEGIILAAGRSRRAGVFKPTHEVGGRPLLSHAIASLSGACTRVIVVAGHRADEVAAIVHGAATATVAVNAVFDDGMFSSVRVGASALSADIDGFFVLPVDCPWVETAVIEAMRATFLEHDGARPIVPVHADRGGHPVLLPARAARSIREAPADATLREIVRGLDPVRLPVAQPSVLKDIDTSADIAALAEE